MFGARNFLLTAFAAAKDTYFRYVTMLLPGTGTNGAQNNTFLDSSTNAFSITRNGNTTQGTFSPYGPNWSNFFDGSGDYLSVPGSSAFAYGTGSFTIEFWIFGLIANDRMIYDARNGGGTGPQHFTTGGYGGSLIGALRYVGSSEIISTAIISDNTWHHCAIVRNGSSAITLYVDGVASGSGTDTTNYTATSGNNLICRNSYGAGGEFNGYLSNFRIVKGVALYTSNFTPSTTPLTAVANTSLLTCQSNRFIDNSTNNFTITRFGETNVQRFSPFNPTASYSAATIGGSGYFDGSGDYLLVANSSNYALGTDNFTIELWVYPTATFGSALTLFSHGYVSYCPWLMYTGSSGALVGYASSTGSSWDILSGNNFGTLVTGAWNHIALCRSGSTFYLCMNGVVTSTATSSAALMSIASGLTIGATTSGIGVIGSSYITNARIIKGTALYTSSYTPPTAPITAVSGTQFLLSATNAGIIDNAMMNDLETVGNAQISTSVSKFGGGSLAFDGTGDWLQMPNSQNFNFGSGNFTVEGWVYCTNTSPRQDIFTTPANGPGFNGLTFSISGGNFDVTSCWATGSWQILFASAGAIVANTWYHFAIVRNGGTLTVYINGTSTYSNATLGTNSLVFGSDPATISYGRINQSDARYLYGYLDDFRITKGFARYTTNFTPPTTPFPTQ